MICRALIEWVSRRLHCHSSASAGRDAVFTFLTIAVCTGHAFGQEPADARHSDRPNIVLIMADDLGYETIGANGGTSYKTPALDQLASGGVRFERCYVQPLCTPTRVQLMTGIYNVRNYIHFGVIDPQATTFGNLFRDAGYATCIVGKWQLGHDVGLPKRLGFDETCLWQHTRRPPRYANPGLEYNGDERDFDKGEYGPELVNDYALDFIERHKDTPFLLYYPMILTHSPYQPTPDSADWDPNAVGEQVNQKAGHFGDMVAYMDKMVGRLVAKLTELEIQDNTLVIFLGDNGTGKGTRSQMGDRVFIGGKGSTNESGMRVPMIVSWPGHIGKGVVCGDLVDSTDFLPTICEAARIGVPSSLKIDGRSFLPQLRGEAGHPREWIYCWYSRDGRQAEVREFAFNARYKLYRDGQFFDLAADVAEKKPLAGKSLEGEAAAAAASLQMALDRYTDARPDRLKGGSAKPAGKRKAGVRSKAGRG